MVFHIQKCQPRFIILPQYSRLATVLALIVYTLVIHPESPERNDVALGELDVVFTSSLSCPINCALSRRERLSCTLFLLMPISYASLSAFASPHNLSSCPFFTLRRSQLKSLRKSRLAFSISLFALFDG